MFIKPKRYSKETQKRSLQPNKKQKTQDHTIIQLDTRMVENVIHIYVKQINDYGK